MRDVIAPGGPIPHIPDDLTVEQFILETTHESRPSIADHSPSLVEDASGRSFSFDEIRRRTHGLANAMSSRWQITNGDVVCIYGPNHIDYPIAVWAIHRLGAVVTPANPAYTSGELEFQISTTHAKLVIVHPGSLDVATSAIRATGLPSDAIILFDAMDHGAYRETPTIEQLVSEGLAQIKMKNFIPRSLSKGEGKTKLAFLNFSSGTTGKPKAVCIPHFASIAAIIQMAHLANSQPPGHRKITANDIWLALTPFYHIYGLIVVMLFAFFYGATLVIMPKFHLSSMLRSIEHYRITMLPVVPPTVVLLCKHADVKKYDLSSIKFVMSGAAPLSAELIHQLSVLLPSASIGQGYGMTETVGSIAFPQIEQKICTPGSAGRLVPGNIARVVRPDGSLAPYGEAGQLLIKGPAMAIGYMNNEEATKETFVNGWIYTGDEVIINEQAEIFILDRIKEMLKVKGYQVAPAELEGHLLDHPAVSDTCVVGLPDEYSGEVPFAFVVLSASARERVQSNPVKADFIKTELRKHVSDAKVHYKHLGGVEFIDSIPKNPSGKLLRRVLREYAKELQKQGKISINARSRL